MWGPTVIADVKKFTVLSCALARIAELVAH